MFILYNGIAWQRYTSSVIGKESNMFILQKEYVQWICYTHDLVMGKET